MERDRNLLFGVFAVQLRKVSPADIMAAAAAWSTDPSKELPERLVDEHGMPDADRHLIEKLVDQAIEVHQGDVTATLAAFGGEALVDETFQGTVTLQPEDVSAKPSTAAPAKPLTKPITLDVQETPGRYTIRAEHARGGQGLLLLAYDEQLGREVILKELLPDAVGTHDSPTPSDRTSSVVARFLREARVTGQLEHPSIVPVYELGQREDGNIYYTMKLVRGKTLGEAIHERPDLRDRLGLLPHFVDLCQGVAYAHSRGIIHRDLKPSNVMVGEFGETVVLDWGLAKERGSAGAGADDTEDTLRLLNLDEIPESDKTLHGEVLGTPAYMAPEQARGEIDAIDEGTDVYALGAILYHCITGHAPFKKSTLREMIKQVMSDDPKPLMEVEPDTPRELAAICSRAMQKKPRDRYPSAAELALEVERFLTGAVVRAHQYKFSDHLARWISKNRGVFSTAATAALLLLVLAGYGFVRISNERNDAVSARNEATTERERAEENFQFARDAVDRLYTQIGGSELLQGPGLQPVREELLTSALGYYEDFLAIRKEDSDVQTELANTYYRAGSIAVELGLFDRADEAFQKELTLRNSLLAADPSQQILIANTHYRLAVLLINVEKPAEARPHVEAAFDALDDSLKRDTDDGTARWLRTHLFEVMGEILLAEREFDRSAEYFRRKLAALESLPPDAAKPEQIGQSRARTFMDLSTVYGLLEDFERERDSLESAASIQEQLVLENPSKVEGEYILAQTRTSLAVLYSRDNRSADAVRLFEQAIATIEKIAEASPAVDHYQYSLARACSYCGTVVERLGNPERALAYGERALEIMETLYTKYPEVAAYKAMGATAYARVRRMQRDLGISIPLKPVSVKMKMPRAQGPIVVRLAAISVAGFESELRMNDMDFAQTGGMVLPDLPFLAQVGLLGGDIILSINDQTMSDITTSVAYLNSLADELTKNPGGEIRMQVERWKHELVSIHITLE